MEPSKITQLTGHIVVFDTEYTSWEGAKERDWSGPNEYRELVQIAAQRVDVDAETVLEHYSAYVRPRINPELSVYFTDLTHITQAEIDTEGRDFAEVYTEFVAWCDGLPILSYGTIPLADGEILKENIELYGLDMQFHSEQYGSIRAMFAESGMDVDQYTSGEIYRAFGLDLGGHVHNAMHDVDSLVQSLFEVRKRV